MARPVKKGLDFFPVDVVFDDQIELLEAECGLVGLAVLIKLWQKIYQNSYYIEWEEDNALLFARKINTELTVINEVINVCFKRSIFDKDLHKRHKILTSKAIQKRYIKICSDAKRKDSDIENKYNLLNKPQFTPEESTQSKVKESKEKKNTPLEVAINEFKKHRKQLKKPMTDRAVTLFVNKLSSMADTDDKKIELIETAIERGWQTVYPQKELTPQKKEFVDRTKRVEKVL